MIGKALTDELSLGKALTGELSLGKALTGELSLRLTDFVRLVDLFISGFKALWLMFSFVFVLYFCIDKSMAQLFKTNDVVS